MTQSAKNVDLVSAILPRALIALSVIGSFLVLGCLLKYSDYGIDFTDEGFYLVMISNPFAYDYSITQFGYFYHPIYKLLGGDIGLLRKVNILGTFCLAWILTCVFLTLLAPNIKEKSLLLYAPAGGVATSALALFYFWLPTPSYNSLALQSLLISGIGFLLAEKVITPKSVFGWVLIGVGGWLAFMAKPSTALALAIGGAGYFVFANKLSVRLLLMAVAIAMFLLLASALLIDGSVGGFIERLQRGVEFGKYLGGGHDFGRVLRIDDFRLDKKVISVIFLVFFLLLIAFWGVWKNRKILLFIGVVVSITFFVPTILLAAGGRRSVGLGQFQGLLFFGVVFSSVFAGLMLGRIKALKTITRAQWAIGCFFLMMPHIYAFGTNGNYWQAGSSAAIFWLLAGLILLGPLVRDSASCLLVLPFSLAVQAVTATLLQTGLEQPYRQAQPLRLNTSSLEVGRERSTLVLSKGYAEYIATAVDVARGAAFESHTPVIDLSGQSPGILYALGAENIGQAWTIGGYSGSLKLAEAALARTSCFKIATAWVVFEKDGPRSIPTELMSRLGADFPGGYKLVGGWQTAEGAGGYEVRRKQELYMPIKPGQTMVVCHELREKKKNEKNSHSPV